MNIVKVWLKFLCNIDLNLCIMFKKIVQVYGKGFTVFGTQLFRVYGEYYAIYYR